VYFPIFPSRPLVTTFMRMLVVISANSDKRFGLVDKTDGVGGGYKNRQTMRSLGGRYPHQVWDTLP